MRKPLLGGVLPLRIAGVVLTIQIVHSTGLHFEIARPHRLFSESTLLPINPLHSYHTRRLCHAHHSGGQHRFTCKLRIT